MNYNTTTLKNGLRIIHLPNTSKIVYCGYQIKAGTRNESIGEEGLAHFCEHLCFKGTQRYNSYSITNRLESVGGDINAFTNKEDTVFHAAVPQQHFMRAIDILTEIVFNSIFPQAETEILRMSASVVLIRLCVFIVVSFLLSELGLQYGKSVQ